MQRKNSTSKQSSEKKDENELQGILKDIEDYNDDDEAKKQRPTVEYKSGDNFVVEEQRYNLKIFKEIDPGLFVNPNEIRLAALALAAASYMEEAQNDLLEKQIRTDKIIPKLKKINIYEFIEEFLTDASDNAFNKLNKLKKTQKLGCMEDSLRCLKQEADTNPAFSDLLKKYLSVIKDIREKTKGKCDAIGVPESRMPYITLLTCCLLFKAKNKADPQGVNTSRARLLAQTISSFKESGGNLLWTSRVKKTDICQIVEEILKLQPQAEMKSVITPK